MNNSRIFLNKLLDSDGDYSLIENGSWVNAENVRIFSTDTGAVNRIEAVGGGTLLFNTLPTGTNRCIGGCEDEEANRILWCNWNSNGNHGIYCLDITSGVVYTVLLSADITGGLNFSKYAYIHSIGIINGTLYWVNSTNTEPRRLNIDAFIKTYTPAYVTNQIPFTLPIQPEIISWIRRPVNGCPVATKLYDAAYANNFIKNEAFQFCFRLNFKNNETSVLSLLSNLCNYNDEQETLNYIKVAFPAAPIFEDVFSVELVAKNLATGGYSIIKTWSILTHPTEIAAQIAGTAQLTYNFYNDQLGEVLADAYTIKQFESMPNFSDTTFFANNRAFLGGNQMGYDTPSKSSLTISTVLENIPTAPATSTTGEWFTFELRWWNANPSSTPLTTRMVLRTTVPLSLAQAPSAYYYYEIAATVPPYPVSLIPSDCTFVGNNASQVMNYYGYTSWAFVASFKPTSEFTGISSISSAESFVAKVFKTAASYRVGITFYDKYLRKCGVFTDDSMVVKIPSAFITSDYVKFLTWTLSNTNALTEIPTWAEYYSIDITKCQSTNLFLQGVGFASYAIKNSDNLYEYVTVAYNDKQAGIAIDISSINAYGMGYTLQDGDLARIKVGANEYNLSVIDTDGKYVILELKDIGNLTVPPTLKFEIYTPVKKTEQSIYFEYNNIYQIVNPGTATRMYSVLTDMMPGDTYLVRRGYDYISSLMEAMNLSNKFWNHWFTDHGRPQFVDTIGKVTNKNAYCFSNVYLPGSRVNGLSSFEALNAGILPIEAGAIQKMVLASKVQSDGSVAVAICEKQTLSMYLGEQELFDTQGSAFIARSSGVVGSINALKGDYGTLHPESVVVNNGLVYWWDARNGTAIQYSNNGLFPLAEYKMTRASTLFSKKISELSKTDIEALGSFPYIIGGFDPTHKEVLFSIPKVLAEPPKGNLVDYTPAIVYPYDIYDGKGKTLVYKQNQDRWAGSFLMETEKMLRVKTNLYAFKNGSLYKLNDTTKPANFFGTANKCRVMFPFTTGAISTFLSIGIDANRPPDFVHLRTEDPYVQSSDLIASDFTRKEGMYYATILRDRLSPNVPGNYVAKQMRGDRLFGKNILVTLEYNIQPGETLELRFIDISHTINKGHLQLKTN